MTELPGTDDVTETYDETTTDEAPAASDEVTDEATDEATEDTAVDAAAVDEQQEALTDGPVDTDVVPAESGTDAAPSYLAPETAEVPEAAAPEVPAEPQDPS